MWVVLLDGVMGALCIGARGLRLLDADRPKRARIPSYDVGLMPWWPRKLRTRAGPESGLKTDESCSALQLAYDAAQA